MTSLARVLRLRVWPLAVRAPATALRTMCTAAGTGQPPATVHMHDPVATMMRVERELGEVTPPRAT